MKLNWKKLGGQAGLLLSLVGLALVFLGWNGAASYDRVPAQFPYLISGGLAGLSLVVLGAALLVVQNAREERALLLSSLAEIREAVERSRVAGVAGDGVPGPYRQAEVEGKVIAGPTTYHRPGCKLLDGRGPLPAVTPDQAEANGLDPCRACDPHLVTAEPEDTIVPRRRPSRRRATSA